MDSVGSCQSLNSSGTVKDAAGEASVIAGFTVRSGRLTNAYAAALPLSRSALNLILGAVSERNFLDLVVDVI